MHSLDTLSSFDSEERSSLLHLAVRSILYGFENGSPLPVNLSDYPAKLRQERASFVTLDYFGSLRGCIGHLQATQPLVSDVSENAYSAAFRDPRFPPLESVELEGLELHISVLTPAEPINFTSQEDLLGKVRPGIDGLILKLGRKQGTFLPSVWASLPEARSFLKQLKLKAGLPGDYWSDDIEVLRYQTESFASAFRTTTN